MVGVLMPVLGVLLREHHWRYDSIGVATAAGLGTLLMQTPGSVSLRKISKKFQKSIASVENFRNLTNAN